MKSTVSALDVAKYFLCKANTDGDLISNLKMQKLLYYAQAWHLVNFDEVLFHEAIRPWKLGPVVREVYNEFKKFESSPIVYKSNGSEGDPFSDIQTNYLNEFYDVFIKFSAHELVNMSHNETPWRDAFEKGRSEISLISMKEYYTLLLEKHRKNAQKH